MSKELTNYIPLSRKVFDHAFWNEDRAYSRFEAWLDLLQTARFEEAETGRIIGGSFVKWKRGELPTSLRFLAERWNWSKNKVDCFLKVLVSEQMIVKRTANGTAQTIITICKYDSYNVSKKLEGQQKGNGRDIEGTEAGQARDKTNKVKKENNVDDVEEISPSPNLPFISLAGAKEFINLSDDSFALLAKRRTNKSVEALTELSKTFLAEQKSLGKLSWTDVPDLRSHFINWVKKQPTTILNGYFPQVTN